MSVFMDRRASPSRVVCSYHNQPLDFRTMSTPAESKPAVAPVLKGIVNVRESQLRLVTSVRLRWMAVLGQLAAVALIKLY